MRVCFRGINTNAEMFERGFLKIFPVYSSEYMSLSFAHTIVSFFLLWKCECFVYLKHPKCPLFWGGESIWVHRVFWKYVWVQYCLCYARACSDICLDYFSGVSMSDWTLFSVCCLSVCARWLSRACFIEVSCRMKRFQMVHFHGRIRESHHFPFGFCFRK